jgi:hypothetical protein
MNSFVGEREITLCDNVLLMRPSFEALVEIESKSRPLTQIITAFAKGDFKITDVAAIVFCTSKAGTKDFILTFQEIGEMILAEGLMNVAPAAFEVISNVLSGDDSRKKKVADILILKKK